MPILTPGSKPCCRSSTHVTSGTDHGIRTTVADPPVLSNPSCRRKVGAPWTGVAVTLFAGIGGPAAEMFGLVARPLPLRELARVVALGCDHGLQQHVPLRVQSVPIAGGVNVLMDTAM